MTQIIEVTALGFNAESDDTDDRVIWIAAESAEFVRAILVNAGAPFLSLNETDIGVSGVGDAIDYVLPGDGCELVSRLFGFVVADMRAALDTAESFIAGFEGDEAQEGITELLTTVRAAAGMAK